MSEKTPSATSTLTPPELTVSEADGVVMGNKTWDRGMTAPFAGHGFTPDQLPVQPKMSTFEDVQYAIDGVALGLDGVANRKDREALEPEIEEVAALINDDGGIDHLAYSAVAAVEMKKAIDNGGLPDGYDPEAELAQSTRSAGAIRAIVRALPPESREKFKRQRSKYGRTFNLADEMFGDGSDADDAPDTDDGLLLKLGTPSIITDEKADGVGSRAVELLKRKRILAVLGGVALVGVMHFTNGAVAPEHVMAQMQLVGNEHHIAAAAQHGHAVAANHMPPVKKNGHEVHYKWKDKATIAEAYTTLATPPAIGLGYLAKVARKRNVAQEHLKHFEHEQAKEKAENLTLKSMVNPNSPQAAALIDDLKLTPLLDEIRDEGRSGSARSADALVRFVRIMAPNVHHHNAEGMKHFFHDLGIDVGATVFEDVPTVGGGSTINVTNPNHEQVVGIVQTLTQGNLRLGDLPPTNKFLGDSLIAGELKRIYGVVAATGNTRVAGLNDLMMLSASNPYRGSRSSQIAQLTRGMTSHQIGSLINKSVNTILDKFSHNMPTDDARARAIEALRLNSLVHLYKPPARVKRGGRGTVTQMARYRRNDFGASQIEAANGIHRLRPAA